MRGESLEAQYWAKVDKRGPDECWPWTGAITDHGYGQIADGRGGSRVAHRVGYELAFGPIPDGLTVDHRCHTYECTLGKRCPHRRCQNPAHWEAVTNAVNVERGNAFSAINRRKTHCNQGHELSPDNLSQAPSHSNGRYCKTCLDDHHRRYRERNREQIAEYSRAWYAANRERVAEQRKAKRAAAKGH